MPNAPGGHKNRASARKIVTPSKTRRKCNMHKNVMADCFKICYHICMAKKQTGIDHVFTARFPKSTWELLVKAAAASGKTLNAELMSLLESQLNFRPPKSMSKEQRRANCRAYAAKASRALAALADTHAPSGYSFQDQELVSEGRFFNKREVLAWHRPIWHTSSFVKVVTGGYIDQTSPDEICLKGAEAEPRFEFCKRGWMVFTMPRRWAPDHEMCHACGGNGWVYQHTQTTQPYSDAIPGQGVPRFNSEGGFTMSSDN